MCQVGLASAEHHLPPSDAEGRRTLHFDVWMRIVKARNLPAKGLTGSTDAYARVLWGHRTSAQPAGGGATPMITFRTDVRKRQPNPRWDFERSFAYTASADALRDQQLVVQVFHRSPLLGDEPIGSARVSLYGVATAPTLFDLPLLDACGSQAGRISINIKMQQLCTLAVSLPSVHVELSRSVGLAGKLYTSAEVHQVTDSVRRSEEQQTHAKVEPSAFNREMTRRRAEPGRALWDAGEFEEGAGAQLRLSTTAFNFAADSLQIRVWCVRDRQGTPEMDLGGNKCGNPGGAREQHNPLMAGECWLPFAKVYRLAQVSVAEFHEPLWALGQRAGIVSGRILIRNGPQLTQQEHGFFTERGVVPASPMVLTCEPEWRPNTSLWNEPPVVHAHCVSSLPRLPSQLVVGSGTQLSSQAENLQLPPEARQLHMLVQALMKALIDEAAALKLEQNLSAHNRVRNRERLASAGLLDVYALSHGAAREGLRAKRREETAMLANAALAHSVEAHMSLPVPGSDGSDVQRHTADARRSDSPLPAASTPIAVAALERELKAGGEGQRGIIHESSAVSLARAHSLSLLRARNPNQIRRPSPNISSRLEAPHGRIPVRSSSVDTLTERETDPLAVPRKIGIYLTRITQVLAKSHKKSSFSFVYRDQGTLLWTQQLLLKLWSYLLQHVDSVPFAVQQLHFAIILQIMARGELDVGGCVDCGNVNGHSTSYAEFVTWYRRVLVDTVDYVLTKLNRRAVSIELRQFCAQVLALGYFRLPEFRKLLLSSLLPAESAESTAGLTGWYDGFLSMFNSRTSSSSSISTMASQPPSPVAGKSNGQAASVRGAYSCYAGARTGAVPSQTSSQTGAELTLTSYGASAAAGCISVDLGAAAASNEVSKEGAEQLGARMESLRLSPCLDRSGGRGQLNGQGWHSGQGDGLSPEKFAEALTRQNRGEWDQQGLGLDARMASFENAPKDEDDTEMSRTGNVPSGSGGDDGSSPARAQGRNSTLDRDDMPANCDSTPPRPRRRGAPPNETRGIAGVSLVGIGLPSPIVLPAERARWTHFGESENGGPPSSPRVIRSRSSTGGSFIPVEWGGAEFWGRLWESITELQEQAEQRQRREAWLGEDGFWRQRLGKRGHCFCTFVHQWVLLVRRMGPLGGQGAESVPWEQVPGYERIVVAFLLEMRKRSTAHWPESMQQAALALLFNEKLAQPFVAIALRKMNVQRTASVAASLDLISGWFFSLQERGVALPASFDFEPLLQRLRTLLSADHFKILTWTVIFLHNHLHMFSEEARSALLVWLSGEGPFERLLLHWCHHVRAVFINLLVFKVIRRGQHTVGYFPPNGAGVVPLMLASLYARRIEQVQQQHVELQRKSVLLTGARYARGGAPVVTHARQADGAEEQPAGAAMNSGVPTNPTLCYAICAFKQLAELMAKFDQFNEEAKESHVDRTESHFLPMNVLRDELPDDAFSEGANDDW